ncbi:unnamed protein product [Choristocarpus tenellus]
MKTQSPGQLLQHYSPYLETYLVVMGDMTVAATNSVQTRESTEGLAHKNDFNLPGLASTSVVIDFGGQLQALRGTALAYKDLSPGGDAKEAAVGLFRSLRWAEAHASAERLLILGLPSRSNDDLSGAVNDRIYRAASGKVIQGW